MGAKIIDFQRSYDAFSDVYTKGNFSILFLILLYMYHCVNKKRIYDAFSNLYTKGSSSSFVENILDSTVYVPLCK